MSTDSRVKEEKQSKVVDQRHNVREKQWEVDYGMNN